MVPRFVGQIDGGAGYRIEVLDAWNSDLVVDTHGFRGTGDELTVHHPPLRDSVIVRLEGSLLFDTQKGREGYDYCSNAARFARACSSRAVASATRASAASTRSRRVS